MDTNNEVRFDPMTGEPINNKNEEENHGFDPMTGEPIYANTKKKSHKKQISRCFC